MEFNGSGQGSAQSHGAERTRTRTVFSPATDIVETEAELIVVADMPGVDERSVEVTLENERLTIVGRNTAESPQGYELSYGEYESGDYEYAFTISENIDRDQIRATVNQGVLRIRLPKAEPKTRKISVTTT